ncbi:hypothetical protein OL229_04770 [Neisseriaceae bacterium JH1-16]|nr:hypothetical protein [Neisseriaceae bacterium JH1-16]
MSIINKHSAITFPLTTKGAQQLLIAGLAIFASLSYADPLTVGTLVSQGARPLSKEALLDQMPGETLYTGTVNFNEEWTNFADGKVVGQLHDTSENIGYYGTGTWHISDDGKYCVDIRWQVYPDSHWCKAVYKMGSRSKYYMPEQDTPDAIPAKFTMVP